MATKSVSPSVRFVAAFAQTAFAPRTPSHLISRVGIPNRGEWERQLVQQVLHDDDVFLLVEGPFLPSQRKS